MPTKDHFDEMMINIGSHIFDLQIMLTQFVTELLNKYDSQSIDVDLYFPFQDIEKYLIFNCKKIFFCSEDNTIKVSVQERNDVIDWIKLDVTVQYMLASYIHIIYSSNNNYNNLSSKENFH